VVKPREDEDEKKRISNNLKQGPRYQVIPRLDRGIHSSASMAGGNLSDAWLAAGDEFITNLAIIPGSRDQVAG